MTDRDRRLPVLPGFASGPPTLDEARRALGGPWEGGPQIGETVRVRGPREERVGVVVHASPTHRDVWVGAGRIVRAPLAQTEPVHDPSLARVSADACVFASLQAGQRVAYEARDGEVGEGVLAEKLRFGGLVGVDDGRVLAVGFRMLTPAAEGAPS